MGTDTARGVDNGAVYMVVFRYTVTYIRRHGQWVALAEDLARVPAGKQGLADDYCNRATFTQISLLGEDE